MARGLRCGGLCRCLRCGGLCCSVVCYPVVAKVVSPFLWMAICRLISCQIPDGCDVAPESSNTTDIEVIVPSVGQTGTSSVSEALRDMGYRSYHVEERSTFASETLADMEEPSAFARSASRCRIEAISLEPGTDVFPFVLQTSPKAKVVLTWRDYVSWWVSTTRGGVSKDQQWGLLVFALGSSIDFLPWGYILDAMTGGHLSRVLREGDPFPSSGKATVTQVLLKITVGTQAYNNPLYNTYRRGVFKILAQEESYLAHINEIRVLTPPDRLLEFDVKKHGWAELGAFLGRPTPPAETPFPHPRSQSSWTNDTMFDHNKPTYLTCLAIFAVLHAGKSMVAVMHLPLGLFESGANDDVPGLCTTYATVDIIQPVIALHVTYKEWFSCLPMLEDFPRVWLSLTRARLPRRVQQPAELPAGGAVAAQSAVPTTPGTTPLEQYLIAVYDAVASLGKPWVAVDQVVAHCGRRSRVHTLHAIHSWVELNVMQCVSEFVRFEPQPEAPEPS